MALGLTQGGERRETLKADFCEPIMWQPRRLTTLDPASSSRTQTEELGAEEIILAQQTPSNGVGEITYLKMYCDKQTHI
jgi:hypothetical protein